MHLARERATAVAAGEGLDEVHPEDLKSPFKGEGQSANSFELKGA